MYWKLRAGVDRSRKELPVDWDHLQRPGFSPDYLDDRYGATWTWPSSASDWIPTAAAQALIRNNRPLLAYIGGKPARFTSKDHNFLPGRDGREAAHRHQQLPRDRQRATAAWSLGPASSRRHGQRRQVDACRRRASRHASRCRFTLPAGRSAAGQRTR